MSSFWGYSDKKPAPLHLWRQTDKYYAQSACGLSNYAALVYPSNDAKAAKCQHCLRREQESKASAE